MEIASAFMSFMGTVAFCTIGVFQLFEKGPKRLGIALISTGVLSFLWMPWAVYGAHALWTANIATINDLSRPEQVLPPTPVVRPSAAEPTAEKL